MMQVCHMLKISRQAFYKYRQQSISEELQDELIVHLVRDKFFDILRINGLLVKPTKSYTVTTNSRHRFYIYKNLIHHSDRGFQYCCDAYVRLLQKHKAQLSMGEAGNPYDNVRLWRTERVNGILKTEFYPVKRGFI